MLNIKLRYITDPGHGWLEVPQHYLTALDIQDQITHYSYQHGKMAYLEEDLDMATFLNAARANGIQVEIIDEYQENTRIRGYDHYALAA